MNNISYADVIFKLTEKDVISRRHVSHIEAENDEFKRIGRLLDIIGRRSLKQYHLFIDCLRDSNQPHVVNALESDAGLYCKINKTILYFSHFEHCLTYK